MFYEGDMEAKVLEIKKYPDKILSEISSPVEIFNDELKEFVQSMLATMYSAYGVGLAAVQVGVLQRIFVIDIDYDREKVIDANGNETYELSNFNPQVFINPKLSDLSGEVIHQEGCLSLPGLYEDVKRFESLKITFQDINGEKQSLLAKDILAICIQHENDHLNGKVFLDSMSPFKKSFFKKKYLKGLKINEEV